MAVQDLSRFFCFFFCRNSEDQQRLSCSRVDEVWTVLEPLGGLFLSSDKVAGEHFTGVLVAVFFGEEKTVFGGDDVPHLRSYMVTAEASAVTM